MHFRFLIISVYWLAKLLSLPLEGDYVPVDENTCHFLVFSRTRTFTPTIVNAKFNGSIRIRDSTFYPLWRRAGVDLALRITVVHLGGDLATYWNQARQIQSGELKQNILSVEIEDVFR